MADTTVVYLDVRGHGVVLHVRPRLSGQAVCAQAGALLRQALHHGRGADACWRLVGSHLLAACGTPDVWLFLLPAQNWAQSLSPHEGCRW